MLPESGPVPLEHRDVLGRSRQARAYLSFCMSTSGRTPYEKVLLNLISRQQVDGSWGTPDYPRWSDVLTSLAVQTLLSVGFTEDSTWSIGVPGVQPYTGGVGQALAYLHAERAEPGWGEDVHDTCQALLAFCLVRDRAKYADRIDEGFEHLISQVRDDFRGHRDSEWYGPGFFAAALDALTARGTNRAECTELLERLSGMQHDDGYFGEADMPLEFKVFHTSMCISSLSGQGLPTTTESIERALSWLELSQDPSGAWGGGLGRLRAIFTAYGALGLLTFRSADYPAVRRASDWLVSHQGADGSIEGLEGTVMGARVLSKTQAPGSSQILPVVQLVGITKVLRDAEFVIEGLSAAASVKDDEVARLGAQLRRERDAYLIRLSHKRAGQIGLVVGLLGLILAIVALVPSDTLAGLFT
jgi:squalene-hopene cyclase-like protein